MKKTILKQLIVMSRNTFYAIAINCTLCIIAYAENVKGQPNLEDITVSISVKDEELIKVFRLLEKKTPFSFTFNDVVIDPNAKITFSERNVTLYNLLYAISREQHLNFRRVNDNIHVTKAEENVNTPAVINQQAVVHITGVVRDKNGPLPGVSVLVKGTQTGTITDATGSFELDVEENAILQISFIGYRTQEVALGGQTSFDITLEEDVTSLNEVVVTALGVSRDKASLGYTVQELRSDAVTTSGNSNLLDAVNGKLSGVQIQNSGGQPGSGTSVVIRGFSSISFNNQPLYVIDGIPVNNETVGTEGTPTSNRAIDIDPNTVESLTVLKGLAATSLYGIRAANGAIIITTKKGVPAKKGLGIEYSFRTSVEQVNKLHEITDNFSRGSSGPYDNATLWSWGPALAGNPTFPGTAGSGTTLSDLNGDGVAEDVSGLRIPSYKDNYKRFWNDGTTNRHNLALTGGNEKTSYYANISALNQTGIVPSVNYDKYSFLVNGSTRLSDKIMVSSKMNYINTGGKRLRQSGVDPQTGLRGPNGILATFPFWNSFWDVNSYPYKDANGDKVWFTNGATHPQWIVNEEGEDWRVNRLIGNMKFDVQIKEWMKLTWNVGIDTYSDVRTAARPIGSTESPNLMGDINEFRLTSRDITSDFIISGNVKLNSKLDLSYLVGNNYYRWNQDGINSTGTSFVIRDFLDISNTVTQNVTRRDDGRILIGAYGDVTFGYNHMLYLGLTGRNDWSSTLPENNNSFFYPSANLGFIASEMLKANWLSFLKLRTSLARGANDAPTQSLNNIYLKNDPNIFGVPRFSQSTLLRNPNLKPERTSEIEVGFESLFLNNLIGLDFSYYSRLSEDQIIQVPVTTATGYSFKLDNLGSVSNKGIEMTLSINNPIKVSDLVWNTNFNFYRNRGRVEKIADGRDLVILGSGTELWAQALVVAKVGEQPGALYDYPYQRYGVSENDPNYLNAPIVVDANGQPLRNSQRVIMGNVNPDWILGISSSLTYKGAKFGFTLERKQGGDVVNGYGAQLVYSGLAKKTEERFYSSTDALANATRSWGGVFADGSPNTLSAPLTTPFWQNTYRRVGENNIEDASWWRLRNIYLGYSLPKAWLNRLFIQELEITFTARNAWLKTAYSGNDPEISANGVGNIQGFDDFVFPNTKSFELGARVKF
ncbi:MAG TPA: SusC/RagA family TonB-linked outer membrane protein [Cyclobacteriaceae bacterium]|nr:SusC/RagA family TonB-linked outer membrane protein [Cyclobacteriaceae bacterium]